MSFVAPNALPCILQGRRRAPRFASGPAAFAPGQSCQDKCEN